MSSNITPGLYTKIVKKIEGGMVKEEHVTQLPTIEQIREKLSYRGEENSFWWRGNVLAEGKWDPVEKVYSLRNPVFSGMQFPTWKKAFDFLDAEKDAILTELEKLTVIEEDEE